MKKYVLISLVVLTVVVVGGVAKANASTGSNALSGWAWSSNIGWISFNSSDSGAGGEPYNVSVDSSTGNITGYAWSSNIGWISFYPNDTSGCGSAAQVNFSGNPATGEAVTGWAIALAGSGRTDGWNGCIELSGPNHTSPDASGASGVTYHENTSGSTVTGIFNGYAWGGNVVGWINFSPNTSYQVSCTGTDCSGGGNPLSVSCTQISDSLPSSGGTINVLSTGATASGGSGKGYQYQWSIDDFNYSGQWSASPQTTLTYSQNPNPSQGPIQFTPSVKAEDSSGTIKTQTCGSVTVDGTTVNPPPSLTLQIGPDTSPADLDSSYETSQGGDFSLVWNIPEDSQGNEFTSCTAGGSTNVKPVGSPGPFPNWASSVFAIDSNTNDVAVGTGNLADISTNSASADTYVFTVTCSNSSDNSQTESASATLYLSSSNEGEK